MSKFHFSLEPLLKYRKHRRDLCRQYLAGVLTDARALELQSQELMTQREQQLGELGELGRQGEVDIDRSAARRYFAGRLLGEIRLNERQQELIAQQLDLCRRALQQADREMKIVEKLAEKRREEFLHQEIRRDALELEDVWNAARAAGGLR
jgi:flagellar protein FliJ